MKWTKDERFSNDKVGLIKDGISDRVKGLGARIEEFASDGSGEGREDLKHGVKGDISAIEDLSKKAVSGTERLNHDTVAVHGDSVELENEIVSTPESIVEDIVSNAIENTSTSEYTPLEIGSLKIERGPYYSHLFPMTPVVVTNRGCIQVSGKNFDYIQIIQRD